MNWNTEDLRDNMNSRTNIPLLWNIFDSIRQDEKFFLTFLNIHLFDIRLS